jgi:tetrahydromethanopterin S-methyltransferase subunit E
MPAGLVLDEFDLDLATTGLFVGFLWGLVGIVAGIIIVVVVLAIFMLEIETRRRADIRRVQIDWT